MTEPFLDPNGNGLGLIPIKPQHCRRRDDNVAEIGSAQLSLGDDVTPHWKALTDVSRQAYWEALGVLFLTNANPNTDNLPLVNEAKTYNRVSGTDTYELLIGGEPWADKVDVEPIRQQQIRALHDWWDTHPGITVEAGKTLPIQEAGRNTNSSQVTAWKVDNAAAPLLGPDLELVSVDDYTIALAPANVQAALTAYMTAYKPISQTWDTKHQALVAATTVAEVNAVTIPDHGDTPVDATGGA